MMKKTALSLLSLSLLTSLPLTLFSAEILIYNNDLVLTESKEGKALFESFQQIRKSFEEELKQLGENLRKSNELLQKQAQNAALFSEEKLRKQQSKLNKELRDAKRFQESSQEEFEIECQEKVAELKHKMSSYAHQVWKEKKGKLLFDVSKSKKEGLEAYDDSGDITQDVLRVADASFDALQKKSEPAKKEIKSA